MTISFPLLRPGCFGRGSGYDSAIGQRWIPVMPQLIALAVVGTAAYVGYKWLKRQNQRMAERRAQAQRRQGGDLRDLGELEWDEAQGVYRPSGRVSD